MIQTQYNRNVITSSVLAPSGTPVLERAKKLVTPTPVFGNSAALVPSSPFSGSDRGTTDIRTLLNDMITAFSLWIKQGLEDLVETVLDKVQSTIDKMLPEGLRSPSSPQRKELERSAKLLGVTLPPIVLPNEQFYRETVRPAWLKKVRPYLSGDASVQNDAETNDKVKALNMAHDRLEKAFNPND